MATAGAFVLLILYLVVGSWMASVRHGRVRAAVRGGILQLEGVRTSWDIERGSLISTLFILNNGEGDLRGDLVVEFTPDPDRLAESYLVAVVAHQVRRGSRESLVEDLEGKPRRSAKERSLLAYLQRGDRTDNPGYESVLYERGERPNPLVFRKRTSLVTLPSHELTRVTVSQDLPEGRMGELIDRESTRIVDVEF